MIIKHSFSSILFSPIRRACHPNIVQMMALGYQGREAFLVMQFIEGPSLHTVIFPDRDDVEVIENAGLKGAGNEPFK